MNDVAKLALPEKPRDWEAVSMLPCTAALEVHVPRFTIGELLDLQAGTIVETKWPVGAEIPVSVNKAAIAWGELELLGERLAVRLTELL